MPDLSDLKILIIDDTEDLIRFHLRWMEKDNIETFYSMNGQDGIDILRENPEIDLVVLDMNLPDKSGDLVFGELRAINPDLPVIVYSGYSSRLNMLENESNIKILGKPFFLPALKDMIGEMTGRK